jgi:hypothetical protein
MSIFDSKNEFEFRILYGSIKLTFWQKLRWLFGSRLNELRSEYTEYQLRKIEMNEQIKTTMGA